MQELTTIQFINLLRQRNINVLAEDGRLQINAPAGAVDAQSRRGELTRRKADLLLPGARPPRIKYKARGPPPHPPEKLPRQKRSRDYGSSTFLDPGCVAYNIPVAYFGAGTLRGTRRRCRAAVDQLIARGTATARAFLFPRKTATFFRLPLARPIPRVEFTDLSSLPENS